MQNYKVGNEVHVIEDVAFEHFLPAGAVKITQSEADALSVPPVETPAEANARKDAQVNAEFTSSLLAVIKAMDPANATAIIAQAKAARKAEL